MTGVWSEGDVVEVLDNKGYWRESMIKEVMEDGFYFIWVFDSAHPVIVEKSSVRARQEWEDKDSFLMDNKKVADQSIHVLSKSLKRSSPDYASADKAYSKCVQKRRLLVDKEVDLDVIHGDAYSFTGKVDNVQITTDEKTIGDSNGKGNSRKHELNDCSSTASSVASCSITSAAIPDDSRLLSHSSAGCSSQDRSVSLSSDAESYSLDMGEEEEVSSDHELKLHGYRCVLELLYKSGPLSWQQEIELTKLRLKLSVSNDEHLAELRRLKSSRNLGLSSVTKTH
ncbi:uncharacterized protein LOC125495269 [Beta vulgaris subsp. vulgaris]|uniref:uncharacterized protein LOC104887818 n=1 Tax=Beta vulgaris subsp. vulgaris TaxID=3555 RepID=UPI002036F0C5|nr:uncharacterized protein LOC104887818 [Beta vulgaris subsp. vulgaris]XP_048495888.1 uncharacterized protein LOC125495269 [Beta vulgaris subsp. vulgaris]